MHPLADYAAKELKYKRPSTIREDFAFGYEQMARLPARVRGRWRQGHEKAVAAARSRPTTRPTSRRSAMSMACQGFAGSNPVKFMKQYADAGLTASGARRRDRGGRRAAEELRRRGGRRDLGVGRTPSDLDTPSNKRFIAGDAEGLPAPCPAGTRPACTSTACHRGGAGKDRRQDRRQGSAHRGDARGDR